MPDKIHLEVVTPERKVLDTNVDRVEVPGLNGELGILPGHTELISQLKPAGLLAYYNGEERGEIAISDGFVEVSPDRVMVIADKAERPEDIDLARALELKELAERQFQRAMTDPDADIVRATIELERAMIQVQLAERHRR
ncbi:MAG TPA: F0F1 ATP synthase subunit epsilon [Blastocatellia bacterium]|nr:F0F1 ATP synthase subunit epsilon [Blastocatellia bacterium]